MEYPDSVSSRACAKSFRYLLSFDTLYSVKWLLADSESPDQTARMRRLIWAFAVCICLRISLCMTWPICEHWRPRATSTSHKKHLIRASIARLQNHWLVKTISMYRSTLDLISQTHQQIRAFVVAIRHKLHSPWSCWSRLYLAFANSVDPDHLASESALFVIKYVNLYQQSGSNNLIGWKLEVGVAS